MIEGIMQEVEHENAAAPLGYIVKKDGKRIKPDSAPTIAIYNPAGTALVSATSMSAVSVGTKGGFGFLNYDAQTANFTLGETLTGGTSTATARIEEIADAGTTGTLTLSNVQGTFQDNETITDGQSGSATADGAAYTCEYTYALNASSTTNYPIGEKYYAKIVYIISSVTYNDLRYFDVVLKTFMEPLVTSAYIDRHHPSWARFHPAGENADWKDIIALAHMELATTIRKLGNRPACLIVEEELFYIELAFVEAAIAKIMTKMSAEDRDFWIENKKSVWAERGKFAYNTDNTPAITEGEKIVSSGFSR